MRGADERRYYLCDTCALIFADPAEHLPPAEERARYELHQNSIENEGYVRFLNQLVEALLPHLDAGMRGLDYGCGPAPTLSLLLRRRKIACDDYDPLFADRPPRPPYDFVAASESFEHFRRPVEEIERILSLLRPGGLVGVMTERWTTLAAFAGWHYTRDRTHVSFYHADTFGFMGARFGLTPVWVDADRIVILRRGPAIAPADPAGSEPARGGTGGGARRGREY